MIWNRLAHCTWSCDDYKDGWNSVVEPHKDQFKVTVYQGDRKRITFKNMNALDAMNMSESYINQQIKGATDGSESYEQNNQTMW